MNNDEIEEVLETELNPIMREIAYDSMTFTNEDERRGWIDMSMRKIADVYCLKMLDMKEKEDYISAAAIQRFLTQWKLWDRLTPELSKGIGYTAMAA